jgi:hypothetical protein
VGSGRVWKISPAPGLDLRSSQTLAGRYTDLSQSTQDIVPEVISGY